MDNSFNPRYSDTEFLRAKARQRMPRFAFDYLEGGCNANSALARNREALEAIRLNAPLLQSKCQVDTQVELFGQRYAQPFGIAPVGLQGVMWPRAPELLASAAAKANIPFVLSTVSSSSLDKIAELTEGKAWFQLYNPTDDAIREDLLKRVQEAGYRVLVVTVDVPTFGYRPKEIRHRLAMPPKITLKSVLQMVCSPSWLLATALAGQPEMVNLKPYMAREPNLELAAFMNKTVMGPVDAEALKALRDKWQGALVLKGIQHVADAEQAASIGADAIVVSNHGGRQLDAAPASIETLDTIGDTVKDKLKIMFDSGLRSGTDIARALACGADFTFLGRPFMYGVAAMGQRGADHTISMLAQQLEQVMSQLNCENSISLRDRWYVQ